MSANPLGRILISGNLHVSVSFRPPKKRSEITEAINTIKSIDPPGQAANTGVPRKGMNGNRWSFIANRKAGCKRNDLAVWQKVNTWIKEQQLIDRKKSLRAMFRTIDKNDDGAISVKELVDRFHKGGLKLSEVEIPQLMVAMDPNNDGSITYLEFNRALRHQRELIKQHKSKLNRNESPSQRPGS